MRSNFGESGSVVGDLHQALLESGESVSQDELGAQTFGPSTRAAVKHFQTHHTDASGHALGVDGVVGPATSWALEHPSGAPALYPFGWSATPTGIPDIDRVCMAALGDIGLREDPDGSNGGPQLAKFDTCGLPWCALAVSTWYAARAGGSPFGRRASVLSIHTWAKGLGRVLDADEQARPGDLAVFLRAGGHGHIGLIVGISTDARLCTIEGNCSNAVRAMLRDRGKLQAVIRPCP